MWVLYLSSVIVVCVWGLLLSCLVVCLLFGCCGACGVMVLLVVDVCVGWVFASV